jgi:uncharacterized membrane protein YebE (DUF533 family)
MLDQLTIEEKVRLIRFMCSFAWADLDVSDRERTMIRDLVRKLGLPEPAASEAESWLDHPPEEVSADGVVDVMEVENFALFEALLGGGEQAFGDEE